MFAPRKFFLKISAQKGLLSLIYHFLNSKEKLWVNDRQADGTDSPCADNFLGSLMHWFDDDPGLAVII
jgi:hypothetical protein